jgi:hypothetical protein
MLVDATDAADAHEPFASHHGNPLAETMFITHPALMALSLVPKETLSSSIIP